MESFLVNAPTAALMPTITVIIVNYNSGDLLYRCLTHLMQQTLMPQSIYVMDNGSRDSSFRMAQEISGIHFVELETNLGFAAANNLAIKDCNSDYIALLNPDAFPENTWLEKLISAANAYSDSAAFGSRQMTVGLHDILDGVGDCFHISGRVWRQGRGTLYRNPSGKPSEIFSPCAAAALYRRETLIEVGGFDEDYFCYVEDVDLGFRLRLAGHKALYVPDAVVYHVGSATTGGQHSDFSIYHGHRNLMWTYIKNMPGILFWLFLPFHILLTLISVVYFSLQGKGKPIARAKLDAIRGIPKMWQKRKIIQQNRKASISEIWQALDKRVFPLRR
jgi:GT2 family glycosyltransferase